MCDQGQDLAALQAQVDAMPEGMTDDEKSVTTLGVMSQVSNAMAPVLDRLSGIETGIQDAEAAATSAETEVEEHREQTEAPPPVVVETPPDPDPDALTGLSADDPNSSAEEVVAAAAAAAEAEDTEEARAVAAAAAAASDGGTVDPAQIAPNRSGGSFWTRPIKLPFFGSGN